MILSQIQTRGLLQFKAAISTIHFSIKPRFLSEILEQKTLLL